MHVYIKYKILIKYFGKINFLNELRQKSCIWRPCFQKCSTTVSWFKPGTEAWNQSELLKTLWFCTRPVVFLNSSEEAKIFAERLQSSPDISTDEFILFIEGSKTSVLNKTDQQQRNRWLRTLIYNYFTTKRFLQSVATRWQIQSSSSKTFQPRWSLVRLTNPIFVFK